MRVGRILVAVLVGVAATASIAAEVAAAHGAPDQPISRTAACAPDGPHVESAVCRAALAASGRAAFDDWDYVHVADVAGRDREVIPDGALCSGGDARFAGLDLPRGDWPATELVGGAELTFTYRTTIPHQGTFRMYVTTDGYDPEQPLAWSDLEDEPFLTATNPEVVGDAYRMPGRLPDGKTGRHLIFTIWQNSDTPDTYYSCADVVFGAPDRPSVGPAPQSTVSPPAGVPADGPGEPTGAAGPAGPDPAVGSGRSSATLALATGGLAGALALAVVATVLIGRRQRPDGNGGGAEASGSHRLR